MPSHGGSLCPNRSGHIGLSKLHNRRPSHAACLECGYEQRPAAEALEPTFVNSSDWSCQPPGHASSESLAETKDWPLTFEAHKLALSSAQNARLSATPIRSGCKCPTSCLTSNVIAKLAAKLPVNGACNKSQLHRWVSNALVVPGFTTGIGWGRRQSQNAFRRFRQR